MHQGTGTRIEVFYSEDNRYYTGSVTKITDDGRCVILYDDEDTDILNMTQPVWRLEQPGLHLSAIHLEKGL